MRPLVKGQVADDRNEEPRQISVDDWNELEALYARWARSGVARRVAGFPARVSSGGVRGHRVLVSSPEPAAWKTRCSVVGNHRDVRLASQQAVGERQSPVDSLAQRSKQLSVGGDVVVLSTTFGRQRELPTMRCHGRCVSWAWGRTPAAALLKTSTVRYYCQGLRRPTDWLFCFRAVDGRVPLTVSRVPLCQGEGVYSFRALTFPL